MIRIGGSQSSIQDVRKYQKMTGSGLTPKCNHLFLIYPYPSTPRGVGVGVDKEQMITFYSLPLPKNKCIFQPIAVESACQFLTDLGRLISPSQVMTEKVCSCSRGFHFLYPCSVSMLS